MTPAMGLEENGPYSQTGAQPSHRNPTGAQRSGSGWERRSGKVIEPRVLDRGEGYGACDD